MANLEVLALDPAVPQIRAPGVGDGYSVPRSMTMASGTTLSAEALTAAGNLTLSAGTANGVLYLNGSKVATSGSGFVFDGTNVGIGTSSPATKTQIQGASSTNSESRFLLKISDTSAVAQGNGGGLIFQGVYTGTTLVDAAGLQAYKANATDNNYSYGLAFTTRVDGENLTANMRLDPSGNLGLGVTPSAWTTLKAMEFAGVGNSVSGNGTSALFVSNNANFNSSWKYSNTAAASQINLSSGAIDFNIAASGTAGNTLTWTTALKLDNSGNLLVGNTSNYGIGAAESNYIEVKSGVVFAANNTGSASNRNWVISPNGSSAGNLDFTVSSANNNWPNAAYAMSLTSGSNLGLGVTPSAWAGSTALQLPWGSVASGYNYSVEVASLAYRDNANWKYQISGQLVTLYEGISGQHRWFTAPSGTAGNAITFTQAMTLDASSNLIVGGTTAVNSSSGRGNVTINGSSAGILNFSVGGAARSYLFQTGTDFIITNLAAAGGALILENNGSERARITAAGGLAVGTTTDPGAGNIGLAAGKSLQYSSTAYITPEDNVSGARISAPGVVSFWTGSTPAERARIDASGNFGIGTSSPAAKLHVVGETIVGGGSSADIFKIRGRTSDGVGLMIFENATGTDTRGYFGSPADNVLAWYDGGFNEWMRLSSGNLGLGVTPSAWQSTRRVVQVGANGGALWGINSGAGTCFLSNNTYYDGTNFKYINTANATYYAQASDGKHEWHVAGSGTAGNNITFTQAMTLDASGNLGVGATSPGASHRLTIQGVGTAGNPMGGIIFRQGSTDTMYIGSVSTDNNTDVEIFNPRNGYLRFATNNTERARITSGGEFLVGATSAIASEKLYITGSVANYLTRNYNSNASPYGLLLSYTGAAPNGTGNEFLRCDDTGAIRATIRSNGGLANYQSNNVDLSDARTKKDIAPAASMWGKIGALEIVTYKYNDQTHDDLNVGVIAQQVEAVEPVWVDADGFGETPEGEEPLKTVYTKDITFAAIKALQEAMARIEKLEAEMATLKGG